MSFQYPQWENPFPYNYTMPATAFDSSHQDLMDISAWSNIDPSLRTSHIDVDPAYTWQQVQNFFSHPEKSFFAASPSLDFDRGAYDTTGTLLYPPHHHTTTGRQSPANESLCSSEQSACADPAFPHDPFLSPTPYGGHALARTMSANSSHLSHEPELVWPQLQQPAPVMMGHINMSEVQGVPDSQEVEFDHDEGYTDTEAGAAKPAVADDEGSITVQRRHGRHFRHASDGDSGVVLKNSASPSPEPAPHRQDIVVAVEPEQDPSPDSDADADMDSLPQDPDDSDADTSYHPTRRARTRPRRPRRAPRRTLPPSTTPSKITKPAKPSRPTSTATTSRHVATPPDAPRAYICVFHFAGCHSAFANKNEWKRHVSSQHLGLCIWRCSVGACATKRAAEFNRKDLFTQHLRRMHGPRGQGGGDAAAWDARVAALQRESLVQRRVPPQRARCPVPGCAVGFVGARAWDERMEHVGRHLAGVARGREQGGWGQDEEGLVAWALQEGVLERSGGGWGLVGEGGRRTAGEEDCEGEDE